jgi:hypothetical protein
MDFHQALGQVGCLEPSLKLVASFPLTSRGLHGSSGTAIYAQAAVKPEAVLRLARRPSGGVIWKQSTIFRLTPS